MATSRVAPTQFFAEKESESQTLDILLSLPFDSLPGVLFIHAQLKLLAAKQALPEFSALRLRAVGRKWRAS
jgi:hypothetical protein